MERLTKTTEIGNAYFPKCFEEPCCGMGKCIDNNCNLVNEVCKKLAEYETLEEQGLLVRLPVKIGDDIYKIPSKTNYDLNVLNRYKANNRVYHQKVYSIVFSQRGWFVQCDKDSIYVPNVICVDVEYGKTWFLTREEAEKKLEEMKNGK